MSTTTTSETQTYPLEDLVEAARLHGQRIHNAAKAMWAIDG